MVCLCVLYCTLCLFILTAHREVTKAGVSVVTNLYNTNVVCSTTSMYLFVYNYAL